MPVDPHTTQVLHTWRRKLVWEETDAWVPLLYGVGVTLLGLTRLHWMDGLLALDATVASVVTLCCWAVLLLRDRRNDSRDLAAGVPAQVVAIAGSIGATCSH